MIKNDFEKFHEYHHQANSSFANIQDTTAIEIVVLTRVIEPLPQPVSSSSKGNIKRQGPPIAVRHQHQYPSDKVSMDLSMSSSNLSSNRTQLNQHRTRLFSTFTKQVERVEKDRQLPPSMHCVTYRKAPNLTSHAYTQILMPTQQDSEPRLPEKFGAYFWVPGMIDSLRMRAHRSASSNPSFRSTRPNSPCTRAENQREK